MRMLVKIHILGKLGNLVFLHSFKKQILNSENISGDIVTEIKMTVGQGDSKGKLDGGRDVIRVPPPVDVSSAPSHALAGIV